MKKNIWVKAISGALALSMACGFMAGCGGESTFDNETTPLVFSTQPLDGVFNPFFSTSATDGNVVGMTQMGMIGNDKDGNPTYGDDEMVVVKDVGYVTKGVKDVDQTTTYYFVLKNNIKFSNGSPLTMKDVLFNLYVYLDPVYTGSSTIYSTEIVGLKEYRTQETEESEQDSFMQQFQIKANTRINALCDAAEEIFDENGDTLTPEQFRSKLEALSSLEAYNSVVDDYDKAVELFREELESDYTAAEGSYQDTVFTDSKGNVVRDVLGSDVEQFLYNEGILKWDKNNSQMSGGSVGPEYYRSWTKEQAIQLVFDNNIPGKIAEVVQYWATATKLFDAITNDELEKTFEGTTREIKNIEGIKFINRTEALNVSVKDYNTNEEKTLNYGVPTYNADGSVKEGNEVLAITIKNIDPKAIWNFSFSVAPMYYYSDQAHIAAFDYEENFGVEWGSQTFMNEVVGAPEKTDVPVGAGPYAASSADGGLENIKGGDFYASNIVYYERNPYYPVPALIKKVRYQVSQQTTMVNSLYTGEIDFVEPNAKTEIINNLESHKKEGFDYEEITTSGYGYIGINAGKVPNIYVRRAIMYCINTQECVNYYGTHASAVYRSMSLSNWAYPQGAKSYYPYIAGEIPSATDLQNVDPDYREYIESFGGKYKAGDTLSVEDQEAFIRMLVGGEDYADYSQNSEGIYFKGSDTLNYRFTIVGDETDHPGYMALFHAAELLNKWGFKIDVKTDHDGLNKLATGDLTVWAAAWGSTIDPDMYQVYHIDSTATSVLNWGYREIIRNAGGLYNTEKRIVEELSDLIDEGREVNEQSERKPIYADALDLVMELAVELPTYQRTDLFAYNAIKIDESSFTPEQQRSAYKGLTSDIHLLSLNVER